MGETPGERPLRTLGGWQGEGVSAGDAGSLLCTQDAAGGDRGTNTLSQTTTLRKSRRSRVIALMCHPVHISRTNVALRPNEKDRFPLVLGR